MKSPCIKKCKLQDGECLGCFRTVEEIRNWRNMNEQEKREVCSKVRGRRSSVQGLRDEGVQDDCKE